MTNTKLPWSFYNTGSAQYSLSSSLYYPALQIRFSDVPFPAAVGADIKYVSGEGCFRASAELSRQGCSLPTISAILNGEVPQLHLCACYIGAERVKFCLRDVNQPRGRNAKPINSTIVLSRIEHLTFEAQATNKGGDIMSQLLVQYSKDVAWGRRLDIVQRSPRQGVTRICIYPSAAEENLHKFLR